VPLKLSNDSLEDDILPLGGLEAQFHEASLEDGLELALVEIGLAEDLAGSSCYAQVFCLRECILFAFVRTHLVAAAVLILVHLLGDFSHSKASLPFAHH
jgi:hypothetical protein